MTSDKDKIEKVVRTIADARAMAVTVLPPDINESDTDFKVVYTHPAGDRKIGRSERVKDKIGPQIRFGLGAVRGVGGSALETLFEARAAGGPFVDLFDFASRVDAKKINKSVLEALVQCGAFDSTLGKQGVSRARAFASIDTALERSRAASRDRDTGQTNLFGLFDAAAPTEESREGDALRRRLRRGHAVGSPRDAGARAAVARLLRVGAPAGALPEGGVGALARFDASPASACSTMDDWAIVRLAGMVGGYREKMFKDGGGKVAFFELEDLSGRVTVKVRGTSIDTYAAVLNAGEPVLLTGKVSFPRRDEDAPEEPEDGPREPTIFLNEAHLLVDAVKAEAKALAIRLDTTRTGEAELGKMAEVLSGAMGSCPVMLHMALAGGAEVVLSLGNDFRVEVSDLLFSGLEKIFGEQVAELR